MKDCKFCGGTNGGHYVTCVDHPSQAKVVVDPPGPANVGFGSLGLKSEAPDSPPALDHQEGGDHYKDMPIQPAQYIHANALGYFEGNVVKYVSRWRKKNGVEDLKKARHYIDLLLDLETKRAQ